MSSRLSALLVTVLLLSAAVLPGCGEDSDSVTGKVTIGSWQSAEGRILGELAKLLIQEHTSLDAENIEMSEGSQLLHSATVAGDLDMYGSWTGTQFTGVLDMEVTDEWKDREKVYEYTKEQFEERFDQTWLPPLGFNNTYALKMRRDTAEEHGIETISDLREVASDLKIGTDATFQDREGDGYNALTEHYELEFKEAVAMDSGLMYRAVDEGDVDIIVAYATDGRTVALDLVLLDDDEAFFPPYDGAYVIRRDVLRDHPEVEDALSVLWGEIDEERMIMLNARVDVDEEEYQDVAREFLQEQGWID